MCSFQVTVSDDGVPPAVAVATIQINIADVNDNAPEFEFSHYVFQILDTTAINSKFMEVKI